MVNTRRSKRKSEPQQSVSKESGEPELKKRKITPELVSSYSESNDSEQGDSDSESCSRSSDKSDQDSISTFPSIPDQRQDIQINPNLCQEAKDLSHYLKDQYLQQSDPFQPDPLLRKNLDRELSLLDCEDNLNDTYQAGDLNHYFKLLEDYRRFTVPTLGRIFRSTVPPEKKLKALDLFHCYYRTDKYDVDTAGYLTRHVIAKKFNDCLEPLKINNKYYQKILQLNCDHEVRVTLLQLADNTYEDDAVANRKIDWYLKLPYKNSKLIDYSDIGSLCQKVLENLNRQVYGLSLVKEKILQYLHDSFTSQGDSTSKKILALKGNPGTGKTKICSCLAEAVGLCFAKISFGGLSDSSMISGSKSVWMGAEPSEIIKHLARLQCNNPVILLDEIDKISSRHGLQDSLLHLLDPVQNSKIQDLYLNDISHDFSKIWFVATMNNDDFLPQPLKDRLTIVEIPDYTDKEIIEIVKQYTIPKELSGRNLLGQIIFPDKVLEYLLERSPNRPVSVRVIEGYIATVISSISLWNIYPDKASLATQIPDCKGYPYTVSCDLIDKVVPKKDIYRHPMYI